MQKTFQKGTCKDDIIDFIVKSIWKDKSHYYRGILYLGEPTPKKVIVKIQ